MSSSPSLALAAQELKLQFEKDLASIAQNTLSEALVEHLRIKYLGRKGEVTALFEAMKGVSKEERPEAGKALNLLRQSTEDALTRLKTEAREAELERRLSREPLDITLPVSGQGTTGGLHPVTLVRQRIIEIFQRHGFSVYDGPEIETDFYNFSALNIPENHPARDMQDTFFVESPHKLVLRTHTSNTQIHAMLKEKPPLRLIIPGRVYRVDNDATHSPMFHQVEAVVVDEGISFAHLKGIIQSFTKEIFGSSLKTRFRPSYFPFVEPGAEVDVECALCRGSGCRVCKNTGWLEIGGCGMIHPNVFESVNYDSEIYTGYAFGFGLDRMAMLVYGLNDLRLLFEGDHKFQKQFGLY